MSIRVMSAVWDLGLPAKEKLVLLALADCANDEGLAWPSIATLARKCGCDQRTIQRNLRDLETAGHVRREEVLGKGNRYFVTPGKSPPRQNDGATKATKTPGKSPPKPSRTITKTKGAREHPLPDDWKPREFGSSTKSRAVVDGWSVDELTEQIERFTAHHRTRGQKFVDWQEAWSTWVLNFKKFNRSNRNARATASNDEIQNPYVRAALEREAARSSAFG